MKKAVLSASTVGSVHRVLRMLLDAAVDENESEPGSTGLVNNPAYGIKLPRILLYKTVTSSDDTSTEVMQVLNEENLEKLLKGFEGNFLYVPVLLAMATGMRRGEVLATRFSDIDFDRCSVRIERSVEETKAGGIGFKTPKNKSSKRTIDIAPECIEILRCYRQKKEGKLLELGGELPKDALLISKSEFEFYTPYGPRNLTRVFRQRAKKLGFQHFRFHDLRHSHASHLIADGTPLTDVSQRLGHSDSHTTLSIYAHYVRKPGSGISETMSRVFRRIREKKG